MAFPSTRLPIVARIAPGADPVDPSTWSFVDISDDIRSAGGIEITVGRQDETSDVNATSITATVDNRSGDYCRTNPLGAYYGLLTRGTPLEAAVTRINDTFTRSGALGTDADSGLAWTVLGTTWATTGSAATSAIGSANLFNQATTNAGGHDVDVTHVSSLSAVTTGAAWVDATIVRRIDDNNYYRLHTEFGTGGVISCKIMKVVAGSSSTLANTTSTGVSYSAGTVIKTRVRAVGSRLQIRAWLNSGTEPTTWTCEADDTTLVDGTSVGLYEWRVVGNTNVGTLTCTIDDYRCDVIRATTPVPEWPVRWDQSGNDVTVPIIGAGILRRLSQGQPALRSPIYRQLAGLTSYVQGYWPLEDSEGATSAANAVTGRPAAVVVDGTFGATTGPPGATSALTLNTAEVSRVQVTVPSWTVAEDGYAFMFYVTMPNPVSGGIGKRLMEVTAAGTIRRWVVDLNDLSLTINAYLSDGTVSFTSGPTLHGLDVTRPWAIQLETIQDGGNVDWSLLLHAVGSTSFGSMFGTYAGTVDRAYTGAVWAPVDGTVISHMWLGDDQLPFVDSTFMLVSAGYAGETAGDRLVRLADESGIPLAVIGDTADTSPMGAQTPATLVEAMRQSETADQGILHERAAGLAYLTRKARYNGDPVMELDFTSGHVAAPPEPTDDDQRLRNRIILRRTGGSEVTAEDEDSIAVDGAYVDELEANLQTDAQLPDHAYWRLHLGTLDGLRWPSIQLNLARNPSLIDTWCKVRIGSRITIANPPDQVGTDDLDLIVEGWTEKLTDYGWDVTIACSPAEAWQVGVYDDAARYDLGTCTLDGDHTAADTTLLLTMSADEEWSTVDEPYDLMISGERVTVTSMGARSGSGPYAQTATVTRAVNGISKDLPDGAPVRIATPGRWAI